MNGNPTSKTSKWSFLVLAALGLCACSTTTVKLQATAGEGMNPNRAGGSGALQVYAFFLKKPDAFEQKDKMLADYLTKAVVDEKKLPAFLEQEAVAVERIEIPPGVVGKTEPVVKTVEVSSETTCVGLVAAFQSHRDNDPDEVWRLVLPVKSGVCAFQVTGRRLEELAPKKKEAPKASSNDG
jgi:type VI secretion system VasD/TssJ family lipoprotein